MTTPELVTTFIEKLRELGVPHAYERSEYVARLKDWEPGEVIAGPCATQCDGTEVVYLYAHRGGIGHGAWYSVAELKTLLDKLQRLPQGVGLLDVMNVFGNCFKS